MEVRIVTPDPKSFLRNVYERIKKNEIKAWAFEKGGELTLSDARLRGKIRFKPVIEGDTLHLRLLWQDGVQVEPMTRGVYLGQLFEMLFTYFHDDFLEATVS